MERGMNKHIKVKPVLPATRVGTGERGLPRGLTNTIVWRAVGALREFPGNPRRHPERQIAGLMKSIKRVWTNPILIDETETILAGHGRLEAAKRLGMTEVPTVRLNGLSPSEKRAVVIADNRLPERAVWDFDLLRGHFRELVEHDFDVELTGFSTGEVDLLMDSTPKTTAADPADDLQHFAVDGPAVSRPGDVWELGRHRLVCGDALRPETYERLLGGDLAQMVVTDPPYNLRVAHVSGRGKVRHREFKMASGEMSESAFTGFLEKFIRYAIRFSRDGAIHYLFMDWRHLPELLNAARPLYSARRHNADTVWQLPLAAL
jgi:hypothetical protein